MATDVPCGFVRAIAECRTGVAEMSVELLSEAWRDLGGDPLLLSSVRMTGPWGTLPARLPVTALAQATVGAASAAAIELAAIRQHPGLTAIVDTRATAVAFTSERHLRLGGQPQVAMDPLSRFWPVADGWVRSHGNYPHHREGLLRALGIAATATPDVVGKALSQHPAAEVEQMVTEQGGLAVTVREPEEWLAHPQGASLSTRPLLELRAMNGAETLRLPPIPPVLPAFGVRVLDLTRVIAGPVGTRTLALLGADVLRVDSPRAPEIPGQHWDTGPGKRSTLLDLEHRADRASFAELLAAAHVVVTGYRPGALDRFGLDPAALLQRLPDLVVATLSAWGTTGPWASRRGFDSLVQAATGIARIEAHGDPAPAALPAQALDHGTGYLLAAAVLRGLSRRLTEGGGWHAELALAQTAGWLLRHHRPDAAESNGSAPDPGPWLREVDVQPGRLRHAAPPFTVDGAPETWASPPVPWGSSPPTWR
jgi:hypothetical protein